MRTLVTGFPGTGKSTVAHELKRRGYDAYDPEAMRGYMQLEDRQTGRHIRMPDHPLRGWFDIYGAYNWNVTLVSRLISDHETIFVCSLADNMQDFYHLFDTIIVLVLDDFELEARLRARAKFIDTEPAMLADTLTLHRHFEESLVNHGAIAVNVHADAKTITDRVLTISRA